MNLPKETRTVAFVYVSDLDRAIDYYQRELGLKEKSRDPFGAFVESAGALIRMTPMPDREPSPHPALGWEVPDIEATVRELRGRGVEFTIYEGMGQDDLGIWTAPDGSARVAWFTDCDGNVLSLSQATR